MARLHLVNKSQKDHGTCGKCGAKLKKGEPYYWWENRIGRSSSRKQRCVKCRPRPSDMTTSDKLGRVYAAKEGVEDALAIGGTDLDALKSAVTAALRLAADELRDVGQEYRDSKDNMPEGLQEGEVGQQCEENADNLESWADEFESAADEVEGMEFDEDIKDEEERRNNAEQKVEDAANWALDQVEL